MKGLLTKDFKLIKSQRNIFLVTMVFSAIMAITTQEVAFPISFLTFLGSLLSISSLSYDELDNGFPFLFSLPITRKKYVQEKYLFGFILGGAALFLGILISLVAVIITKAGSYRETFTTAGVLFPILLLLLAIMLPLILKFGSEKGRTAIMVTMGVIAGIVFLSVKIIESMNIDVERLLESLPQVGIEIYILFFLLFSVIFLVVSYVVSLTIIKKKEF